MLPPQLAFLLQYLQQVGLVTQSLPPGRIGQFLVTAPSRGQTQFLQAHQQFLVVGILLTHGSPPDPAPRLLRPATGHRPTSPPRPPARRSGSPVAARIAPTPPPPRSSWLYPIRSAARW